jgi:hypothetical protein
MKNGEVDPYKDDDPISARLRELSKQHAAGPVLGYLDYSGVKYPITKIELKNSMVYLTSHLINFTGVWECKGTVKVLGTDGSTLLVAHIKPEKPVTPTGGDLTITQTVQWSYV